MYQSFALSKIVYRTLLVLLLGVSVTLFFGRLVADAAITPEINYQGKLLDNVGALVADGSYSMTFRLYTVASSGTAIWTETQSVTVDDGLFSVMLGSSTSLTGIDFDQALYLGLEVASDGEMTPRKKLGSVPSAFLAEQANDAALLGGVASSSFLRSDAPDTMSASSSSTLLSLIQSGAGDVLSIASSVGQFFTASQAGMIGIGTGAATPTQALHVAGNARITGALYDSSNSAGTNGYVLLSTGTGTSWVATSTLGISGGGGSLAGLSDVSFSGLASGEYLSYNGTNWVNTAPPSGSSLFTDGGSLTYLTSTGDDLAVGTSTQIGSARLSVDGDVGITGGNSYRIAGNRVLTLYDGPDFGYSNLFVGTEASNINTANANQNTVVGFGSLSSLTTGANNLALGAFSLSFATSSSGNTAVGFYTLHQTTSGQGNTAVGGSALRENTTGEGNVAVGANALEDNTTGYGNVGVGVRALEILTSGAGNTAIGPDVAQQLTTGSTNIAIGYRAGGGPGWLGWDGITTGSRNIVIGTEAMVASSSTDNQLSIGNLIYGTGLDGSANIVSTGNIGIGTTTPSSRLTIAGDALVHGNTVGTLLAVQQDGAGDILDLRLGATSVLLANNSGDVGIGTTTPSSKLTIAGDLYTTGAFRDSTNSAGTNGYVLLSTGTGTSWVATSTLGIGGGGGGSLAGLSDVSFSGLASGEYLSYNGTNWVNTAPPSGSSLFTDGGSLTYLTSTADNLAVGTSTQIGGARLSVDGDVGLPLSGALSIGGQSMVRVYEGSCCGYLNYYFGSTAGGLNTSSASSNTAVGQYTLTSLTDGSDNTAMGRSALSSLTTGSLNSAFGLGAMEYTTTASYSVAIGLQALRNNEANGNVAIGAWAMANNTTGDRNIAIGQEAMVANISGEQNVAIGVYALADSTSSNTNVAIGGGVLRYSNGSDNVGVGAGALGANTSGAGNVALGAHALANNQSGVGNLSLGAFAMASLVDGEENIAIGKDALNSNVSGAYNIAIGKDTGRDLVNATSTGSNTFIGHNTGRDIVSGTNNTIIGANVTGLASTTSNTVILADGAGNQRLLIDSDGEVGIQQLSPNTALHVGSSSVGDGTNLITLQDENSSCVFDADSGSPTCGSDIRLKKDVQQIENELDTVLALEPKYWRFKSDDSNDASTLQSGFIAQEVEEVLPELVSENEWIDGSTKKFLNIAGMMPYVVGAIKELWEEVLFNRNRINELEQRLEVLEAQLGTTPSGDTTPDDTTPDTQDPPDTTETPSTTDPNEGSGEGNLPPANTEDPSVDPALDGVEEGDSGSSTAQPVAPDNGLPTTPASDGQDSAGTETQTGSVADNVSGSDTTGTDTSSTEGGGDNGGTAA